MNELDILGFETKAAAHRFYKKYLAEHRIGAIPEGTPFWRFIDTLFRASYSHAENVGCGVSHYAVRDKVPGRYEARGIDLHRHDKTIGCFSPRGSIDDIGKTREQIAMAILIPVLRQEIEYQVIPHRMNGHDVHHEGIEFKQLASTWIESIKLDPTMVKYETFDDRTRRRTMKDRRLASKWCLFHKQYAVLRTMPMDEHKKTLKGNKS